MTKGWFLWLFFVAPLCLATVLDIAIIPYDIANPQHFPFLHVNLFWGAVYGLGLEITSHSDDFWHGVGNVLGAFVWPPLVTIAFYNIVAIAWKVQSRRLRHFVMVFSTVTGVTIVPLQVYEDYFVKILPNYALTVMFDPF